MFKEIEINTSDLNLENGIYFLKEVLGMLQKQQIIIIFFLKTPSKNPVVLHNLKSFLKEISCQS
jgi:hypothetical protein